MKKLVPSLTTLIILILVIPIVSGQFTATAETQSQSICAGSTVLYTVQVEGTGDITTTLDGSASSWATATPQGFSLQDETKTLFIYVTPNSKVIPGSYSLNTILNDGSNTNTIPLQVNVNDCHGLEITGPLQQDICSCNVESYDFTISNKGNFQEVYDLSVTGEAKSLVTLSPEFIVLNPGESSIIKATASIPCDQTGPSQFSINANARTSNAVANYNSNINAVACYNFDVTTDKDFVNFCEHSLETIKFTISNSANTENRYNFEITGPGWANLEKQNLILPGNSVGIVNLLLTPDFKVKGDFEINVHIEDELGKIKQDKLIQTTVRECNSVSLDISKDQETTCQGLTSELDVILKNTGEVEQSYKLTSNIPWITLENPVLTLAPEETSEFKLNLNPSNTTSDSYSLELSTEAVDSSKVSAKDTTSITVLSREACYRPSLTVNDIDVSIDGNSITPISIKNEGQIPATYNIEVTGTASSFSQVNPAIITVQPGDTEEAHVYTAPSITVDKGKYTATVSLIREGSILTQKDININVGIATTIPTGQIIQEVTEESILDRARNFLRNLFNIEQELNETQQGTREVETVKEIEDLTDILIEEDQTFIVNEEIHTITIQEVTEDTVTVLIESDPILVVLKTGETKDIDLDEDNQPDLRLILEEIDNGKPKIRMLITSAEEIGESKETEEPKITSNSILSTVSENRNIAILAIIVIIGLAILIIFRKRIGEFFEEEDEDDFESEEIPNEMDDEFDDEFEDEFDDEFEEDVEEQELKIGKYIFGLIILGAIVFFGLRYNLTQYVQAYKNFLIIGLVILLVILLIIRFWNNIIEFFEEEDEIEEKLEKKPKKKTKKK